MARYRSTVVLALFVAAAAATVVTAAKGPHTLYEAALAEPEAAKVVEKIESSGLITQFQKPNLKVTVFVPSNAAFERITKAIAYNDKARTRALFFGLHSSASAAVALVGKSCCAPSISKSQLPHPTPPSKTNNAPPLHKTHIKTHTTAPERPLPDAPDAGVPRREQVVKGQGL